MERMAGWCQHPKTIRAPPDAPEMQTVTYVQTLGVIWRALWRRAIWGTSWLIPVKCLAMHRLSEPLWKFSTSRSLPISYLSPHTVVFSRSFFRSHVVNKSRKWVWLALQLTLHFLYFSEQNTPCCEVRRCVFSPKNKGVNCTAVTFALHRLRALSHFYQSVRWGEKKNGRSLRLIFQIILSLIHGISAHTAPALGVRRDLESIPAVVWENVVAKKLPVTRKNTQEDKHSHSSTMRDDLEFSVGLQFWQKRPRLPGGSELCLIIVLTFQNKILKFWNVNTIQHFKIASCPGSTVHCHYQWEQKHGGQFRIHK